jgi:hypothetical protein
MTFDLGCFEIVGADDFVLPNEEDVVVDAIDLYALFGFEYFVDVVEAVLNWTCFCSDIIASLGGAEDVVGVGVVDGEVVLVGKYF